MGTDDIFSDEIDPEIAALLGIDSSENTPNYEILFDEDSEEHELAPPSPQFNDDITREDFTVPKVFTQSINPICSNKSYYKAALNGEGEVSSSIHETLSLFLKCSDKQERLNYRVRLISQYWELFKKVSRQIGPDLIAPKKLMLRYGLLLPNIISSDQRDMIGSIIEENTSGEPIHYFDEWLNLVATGEVSPLATDDLKPTQRSGNQKLKSQLDRVKGSRDAHLGTLKNLQRKRTSIESIYKSSVNMVCKHSSNSSFMDLENLYTDEQTRELQEILQMS